MNNYIKKWKDIDIKILEFLENKIHTDEDFQTLTKFLDNQELTQSQTDFEEFLHLITSISKNHHRFPFFNIKIKQIIHHFSSHIKQTFSNFEIYNIFKSDKQILRHLLDDQILVVDEKINTLLTRKYQYLHYFLPEIELPEDYRINSKDSDDEKRENGENESYICSLIRTDSVQEFITYVNKENISLSNTINPSLFETNSFLLEKKPTLIEYVAFFGSIQIFQYLQLNRVDLTPSLWLYSIHSKNPELIHFLEDNHVEPKDKTFLECFLESIKCHHNDIADYIQTNLLNQNIKDTILNDEVSSAVCKYHNFSYFPKDLKGNSDLFFYLSYYNYSHLIRLYLDERKNYFDEKIIFFDVIFTKFKRINILIKFQINEF